MIRAIPRKPYLFYLPFLAYYSYIVFRDKWPSLYGDEIRYVDFARNLTHGFYSPFPQHINLWNGPGYPLLMAPLLAMHVPALYMTLLNAVFLYLTVVFTYKALSLVTNHRVALVCSLLLAVYPNAQSMLPILYTEAFTGLQIALIIYFLTLYHVRAKNKYLLMAGLLLGYLVLTKIIFGYVVMAGLVGYAAWYLVKKRPPRYRRYVRVFAIAFAVTVPYLAYTFYITKKPLYWGDSGGMSLYWMSSPYEHEYGDWKVPELTNHQYPTSFKSEETKAILRKNHKKEIDAILKYPELKQDELFKQAAIRNIMQHPFKFVQNYYYNWGRMLFNFPYSYSYQEGPVLGNILRGSLILWASVIGIIVTIVNRRRLIFPLKMLLFVTGVYLLLSGALSAYPRQLDVIVPVLLFWFGFLAYQMKMPQLRFANNDEGIETIDLGELAGISVNKDGSLEETSI